MIEEQQRVPSSPAIDALLSQQKWFEGIPNKPYDQSVADAKAECGWMENGIDGANALKLISLLCKLTQLAQTKKPEARAIHLLVKACGKPATPAMEKDYRQISVMCDLFLVPTAKFSTYECTSVDEMLKEIVRLMDLWLPF